MFPEACSLSHIFQVFRQAFVKQCEVVVNGRNNRLFYGSRPKVTQKCVSVTQQTKNRMPWRQDQRVKTPAVIIIGAGNGKVPRHLKRSLLDPCILSHLITMQAARVAAITEFMRKDTTVEVLMEHTTAEATMVKVGVAAEAEQAIEEVDVVFPKRA